MIRTSFYKVSKFEGKAFYSLGAKNIRKKIGGNFAENRVELESQAANSAPAIKYGTMRSFNNYKFIYVNNIKYKTPLSYDKR